MAYANRRRRTPDHLRQTVRRYYRNVVAVALVGVTLVALYAGEKSLEGASATRRQAARPGGARGLLSADDHDHDHDHRPARCSDPDIVHGGANSTTWQHDCCVYPPAKKADLKKWKEGCKDSVYLSGNPYLACLQKWHDGAKDVPNNSSGGVASLKRKCSDMGVYQVPVSTFSSHSHPYSSLSSPSYSNPCS